MLIFPIIMMMIFSISILLFMISYIISKKKKNDREKMSPFECGFNLFNSPRNPFSLRFFLISIIFLVFDIEIILLLPFILNLHLSNSMILIITISLFLFILLWGLIHEWFLGSLEWI